MRLYTLAKNTMLRLMLFLAITCFQNFISAQDYFPLQLGNQWVFESYDTTGTITWDIYSSFREDNIAKFNTSITEYFNGDTSITYHIKYTDTLNNNEIYSLDNNNLFLFTKHQLVQNDSFFDPISNRLYTVEYYGQFECPAGVFDSCYYVWWDTDQQGIDKRGYVFAPDVGPVGYITEGRINFALIDFSKSDLFSEDEQDFFLIDDTEIAIDDSGGRFVANQFMVQFEPDIPETEREILRQDSFGVVDFKTCICNKDLELWIFDDQYTEIIEKKKKAESSSCVEKISNNYLVHDSPNNIKFTPPQRPSDTPGIPYNDKDMLIVVPDTGLDSSLLKTDELSYIFNDDRINKDDWAISSINKEQTSSLDIHDHGTLVLKTLINTLAQADVDYEHVKILPLKTHGNDGKGLLFDATCSFYYAMKLKADMINVSWGHYGEPSEILQLAIDSLETSNILLVTGAGNENKNLNSTPFYPAVLKNENILVATSLNNENELTSFSNYSKRYVDVGYEAINGTSFAAPVFLAILAKGFLLWGDSLSYNSIIDRIFDCSIKDNRLSEYIKKGRILNIKLPCHVEDKPIDSCTGTIYTSEEEVMQNDVSLVLYDQFRRVIARQTIIDPVERDIYQFNVSTLPNGIYYVGTVYKGDILFMSKAIKL